ncbi:hypothetical protein DFH06DRAFT_1210716 [Mycena polygramma]|nr:hypothetical protein DFH06DRAFT_1210716 [Mycena polygramma]
MVVIVGALRACVTVGAQSHFLQSRHFTAQFRPQIFRNAILGMSVQIQRSWRAIPSSLACQWWLEEKTTRELTSRAT